MGGAYLLVASAGTVRRDGGGSDHLVVAFQPRVAGLDEAERCVHHEGRSSVGDEASAVWGLDWRYDDCAIVEN